MGVANIKALCKPVNPHRGGGAALGGLLDVTEARIKQGTTLEGRRHANWHKKVAAVENGFHLLAPSVQESIFLAVSEAMFSEHFLEILSTNRALTQIRSQSPRW